jgi:hypothetical protein
MKIPVTTTEVLTIATLVMAIFSMLLSSMALWPQLKDKLASLRDTVLWMAMVAILVAAVTMGWKRLGEAGWYSRGVAAPSVPGAAPARLAQ